MNSFPQRAPVEYPTSQRRNITHIQLSQNLFFASNITLKKVNVKLLFYIICRSEKKNIEYDIYLSIHPTIPTV